MALGTSDGKTGREALGHVGGDDLEWLMGRMEFQAEGAGRLIPGKVDECWTRDSGGRGRPRLRPVARWETSREKVRRTFLE